jgi:Arc/MetJ family transcription regulator
MIIDLRPRAGTLYTPDVYEEGDMVMSSRRRIVRTNIVLDATLVARVKRLGQVRTTRDAVELALEHFVRSHDYEELLALHGSGGVADGYDPKAASPAR